MEPPGRRRGQGGAPAAKRGRTTLAGPGTGRYWQAENQGTWSGCLLPALGEQLLVGDRRHPLAGRVPPVVVVVLDPGRDRGAGLGFGPEVLRGPQLDLQGGVPRLDDGVVRADPGLPVDWQMPIRWQA